MKHLFFAFSLTLLGLTACDKACTKNAKKTDCVCLQVYDPVCGCDKVTYGNSCEADCEGVTKYTEGACS